MVAGVQARRGERRPESYIGRVREIATALRHTDRVALVRAVGRDGVRCSECNDNGATVTSMGVDACARCAWAAEAEWRGRR